MTTNTKTVDGITILTNPSTDQVGRCFFRPFKSEAAAVRKARKVGSDTIVFQPENFMVAEDVWYVTFPKVDR